MKISVIPFSLRGEIKANPSKSAMQRAIAIACLSDGPTIIKNVDLSNDSKAALNIAAAMGCEINYDFDKIIIIPTGKPNSTLWNASESGTSARIFAPIKTQFQEVIIIEGQGTLSNRSMKSLVEALVGLGLKCEHSDFKLPIKISGSVTNKVISLDLSSGSQVLSGLLITLPKLKSDTYIKVKNLTSRPYIDLTIEMLKKFGVVIQNNDYTEFYIKGDQNYRCHEITIEGDWSNASFPLVAGAIAGNVTVTGLNNKSKQGDKNILDVLFETGAKVTINEDQITIQKDKLLGFEYDATDTPDLFPPLTALAVHCNSKSRIKGISRLKDKESNRFKVLKQEFKKLGIRITSENDYMIVNPGNLMGGSVASHNDHRIAMALVIAASNGNTSVTIDNAECVKKSYPNFYDDYESIGGKFVFSK